jgi:hypothetical protein
MIHRFQTAFNSMRWTSVPYFNAGTYRVVSYAQTAFRSIHDRIGLDQSYVLRWDQVKNRLSGYLNPPSDFIYRFTQALFKAINYSWGSLQEDYLYLFDWRHHRQYALQTVRVNGLDLNHCSQLSKDNKEVVFAAVSQNGLALEYASARLQADREVVLTAVSQNGLALEYASARLRADRGVFWQALEQTMLAYRHAHIDLKFEFCLDLKKSGAAQNEINLLQRFLEAIPAENNTVAYSRPSTIVEYFNSLTSQVASFTQTAVRFMNERIGTDQSYFSRSDQIQNTLFGYFNYISGVFYRVRQVFVRAINFCLGHLQSTYLYLFHTRDHTLQPVHVNGLDLKNCSIVLKDNKEFVKQAVEQNGLALTYASARLQQDREVVLAAVTQNWRSLLFVGYNFESDKEILLPAIQQHMWVVYLASEGLQSEPEIIQTALCGGQSWRLVFNRPKIGYTTLEKGEGMFHHLAKNVFMDALEKSTTQIQDTFKQLKDLKSIRSDSKETIKHLLLNSESVLLHSGWRSHAVWIHVLTDPEDPNQWVIRIFNAGDQSLTNHPQVQLNVRGQIKIKTAYVEWTCIKKSIENADKLISRLQQIAHLSSIKGAKALYQELKEELGAQATRELTAHQIASAITPQRIGNCSIRSGHAALKAIDIEASREFMDTMRAAQIAIGKRWVAENPDLPGAAGNRENLEALEQLLNDKRRLRA